MYSSAAMFTTLLFFCVTGITLNHSWYGNNRTQEHSETFTLPPELLQSLTIENDAEWQPELDPLLDYVRQKYGLTKPKQIDIESDIQEVVLEYVAPAGHLSVIASVSDAELYVDYRRGSTLGILNDLHKGRYAGNFWSVLIDVVAGLIILFSISGFIIIFQNKRRRKASNWFLLAGVFTPFFLYLCFVPSIP